jgi:predicted nucleic-acid-binding Zn-ribbon protein
MLNFIKTIDIMKQLNYTCPKCQNKTYKIGELRATGGTLSKIFDVQNQKYSSVTCERCSYTEFYKTKTSGLSNVFDFFTS